MNIGYFILPVLVGLIVGVSLYVAQHTNLTGHFVSTGVQNQDNEKASGISKNETKCPTSCDDKNPCTLDWCNETSNYFCSYIPMNGTSESCWGNPTTCTTNVCISGKCTQLEIKNCCGNSLCESSENCNSCVSDCGECPSVVTNIQPPQTTVQPQPNQTDTTQPNTTNETSSQTNITNQTSTSNEPTLNHVIISEIQTASNEFIELYNPTNADVNVAGWYLSYFSSSRDWNNTYRNWAFPNNTILKSEKFFLINIFNTSNSDWTALTAEGSPYSQGQISNNGSIALFPFNPRTKTIEETKNGRIDAIGWGSPAYVFESSPAVTPETGKSLQRNSLNSDTDNNSQDFSLVGITSPQNSTNQ